MLLEGKPFKGRALERLKAFLGRMELTYDEEIEYSVCILNDDYEVIASGSVEANVIKCVAVDPACRGQGLSAAVVSNLVQYLFEKGRPHIFIYTKPKNLDMFADLGFYKICCTQDVLLMENRSGGFERFVCGLKEETPKEALKGRTAANAIGSEPIAGACRNELKIGAVVANCNPFTRGHRYLLEEALKQCDYLHLFILSDNRSEFAADERFRMVQLGIAGLERIILHRTSDYMISAATFPTYFFKDRSRGQRANCKMDLELFASRIAPALGITERFVGTEPFCAVTNTYNEEMKRILPRYGITVKEIRRKEMEGMPVSASEVRRRLASGDPEKVKELVPEKVYEYLCGR